MQCVYITHFTATPTKNYKKMATTVYSVTVTKNNGGQYRELIDNTVCLLLSEAQNYAKGWERKGVRDGEPYEDCIGEAYQYHEEYTNKLGQRTWELREERLVKVEGGTTIHSRSVTITEIKL